MKKRRSRTPAIKHSLTPDQAARQYRKQRGRCAASGVEIHFGRRGLSVADRTASPDRKDSAVGYTRNTFQWLHKVVNKM